MIESNEGEPQFEGIDDALRAWTQQLGSARVLRSSEALAPYTYSTASSSTTPSAVVKPLSTEEVVEVVKTARIFRVPLYPISRGRNWGYGDACAVRPGQVVVDLSGMNRIIHVDEELAYAVIEPGVTQGQLAAHLAELKSRLWVDCTGAGPDTSIVGNVLERGYGHSPYGNRFETVSGMQVVLSDGSIVRTGFGDYPGAETAYLYPYGIGPYVDGIFTQSNLGIVTRMGLWLMPASERVDYFVCSVTEHEDIEEVIDQLRLLRMNGSLRSVVHIANDLRMISGNITYPGERTSGKVPLPPAVRRELRAEFGIGAWTVGGALHGTARSVRAARWTLRRRLNGRGRSLTFLSERKLAFGERLARGLWRLGWARRFRDRISSARALFDLNRGCPSALFLTGAYWRKRGGLPPGFPNDADPAADNCGLLWLSPVLPMRGRDVSHLHHLLEPLFAEYGFDLFVTLSMLTDRALGAVLTISYDKDDPDESSRAYACYRACFEAAMKAGYIPYRVGIQSMGDIGGPEQSSWRLVQQLKQALDPEGIIAPGRYDATMGGSTGGAAARHRGE